MKSEMGKLKSVWVIFWVMVLFFVIIACMILGFVPSAGSFSFGLIIFPAFVIFVGLGVTLIVLTVKTKVTGLLKAFLLLTGASAVGLPVFSVLHNLVYALFIRFFGADFWGEIGDEPVFFILAVIVCPIGYLVGAVGSIVIAIKNKKRVPVGTS
jgi:hypothetical protein